MRNKIIIGCLLLGALSAKAQEIFYHKILR